MELSYRRGMSQASDSDWRETSVGGTIEPDASGTGVTRVQLEGADDVWGRQHSSPGLQPKPVVRSGMNTSRSR